MPTDILCKDSTSATFSAIHLNKYKSFNSNSPPLVRSDHEYIVDRGNGISQSFAAAISNPVEPPYKIVDDNAYLLYLIALPESPNATFGVYRNGGLVLMTRDFRADSNDPAGSGGIRFEVGDTFQVRAFGYPIDSYGYYTWRIAVLSRLYGHSVSDQAGQTEIFLSDSSTKTPQYSSVCGGQCPPGQVRCGDCCLDCKSIAAQIAAIGARL